MPDADIARSYYIATAHRAPRRPALRGEVEADVAIVGGGFTGLSAALHLAERGYKVALVEARSLAWGASGRNGGQLNTGLRKGPGELVAQFGRNGARRLFHLAEEAKATVRERIARHAIACDLKPGVMVVAHKPADPAWMTEEVRVENEVFDYPHVRMLSKAEVEERLCSRIFHGGLVDMGAGHLHPLNYALGLAAAAEAAGAALYEESRALAVTPGEVRTAAGRVRARYILLACNAYLDGLEP